MSLPATDKVDLMFRAFSDRTRLRILNLLQSEQVKANKPTKPSKPANAKSLEVRQSPEICVCDLMRVLDLPQAKVSRHLAYLRKAGLVQGRKIGRWMYYSLLPAHNPLHQQLLLCLAICPAELKALRNDRKQLRKCDCTDPAGCC